MRRIVALASVSLVLATFTAPLVSAQSAIKSITLSPSSTSLTLEKSVAANRNLTIINDGDTPYTVSLNVQPYRVTDENYDSPAFTRLPGTTDASEWVKLSQTNLTLAAHETSVIPYTVNAPVATAAGGYYAVIFAETTSTAQNGVSARNRVGNILYMTVDGQIDQSGSVADADTPRFTFGPVAALGLRVTNKGGTHFQTDAHFTVSKLTGGSVLDKTTTVYVLPQTTRHITQDFAPNGIGGIYKVSRSATVAGTLKALPDSWIVIVKPQIIPLVIFALLTLIGFVILLRRTKKSPKASKS